MNLLTFAFCFLTIGASDPAKKGKFVYSLKPYEGKQNVLLVFAPSKEDARFAKQLETLKGRYSEFKKNQTILFYSFESQEGRAGSAHLRAADSKDLRNTYKIPAGSFRMLFVDKKGAIKRDSKEPLDRDRVAKFISSK